MVYDCPVLQANIGDACDDGDPNTANDVVTADCECVGTVVYDCPVLQANIGDACDDGDPNTANDVVTADCECVGTVVYDCPVLQANIGDACDDGDPNTANDVVTADCECMGTSICISPTIASIQSDEPICSTEELHLTAVVDGTGPFIYLWEGAGTFLPDPHSLSVTVQGAASGVYSLTVSNGCGSTTAALNATITPSPSASISYPGSPICSTTAVAQVSISGTAGGAFEGSTGLVIDPVTGEVDVHASAPGQHTATYSFEASGGCPAYSTTATLVIEQATIWYADADGDGVGTDTDAILACEQPVGYVTISGDACPDDPNKLDPGACGCGVADTDSDGDGVADCIDGCPTDPLKTSPGACGCGIPDTDTDGDGAADCIDGCPTDPLKTSPGACGCGVPDIDSDGDGVPDCIDTCPTIHGQVGDACDDGDPNTANDVVTADCECVGTVIYDCPVLQANIGDACDDGDPNTENDAITADCECVGTVVYDCPVLQANIGDACDDGDPNTANDVVTADCECVGTVVYDCPVLHANIGDACDDGDPNTANDVITADCECVGTNVYDCPALQADIGDLCDDGNPVTVNDSINEQCECEGEIPDRIEALVGTGLRMSLYPNPTRRDVVTLEMEGMPLSAGEILLQVHESSGKRVFQAVVPANGGRLQYALPVPDSWSSGLYTVEVVLAGQHFVARLMVQK